VKRHANKAVKLVFLGTPWANLNNFDLVITTPQYGLPDRANILRNDLPMHKVTPTRLAEEAKIWAARLGYLPKPWTAILVGGASGPYRFAADVAQRLAKEVNALPGSLLVTTSARTPPEVATVLKSALANPNYFHHWQADDTENPFFGFLALADRFIVTADSISMLSEATATGKPVMLFDTESGPYTMRQNSTKIGWRGGNLSTTAFRLAMRLAPPSWSRDLRIVHNQLINSGRASWSDSELQSPNQKSQQTDLDRATTRVRALFDL
jgi:mitochondrial fission protein ELM1